MNCARCSGQRFALHKSGKGRDRRLVCLDCAADRMRERRAANPKFSRTKNRKWEERFPEKRRAHRAVEAALKSGKLIRRPCERCGDTRSQAHHDDYFHPLAVTWLCQPHHRERHRELEALRCDAA